MKSKALRDNKEETWNICLDQYYANSYQFAKNILRLPI